jgi:hypothetical protein
MSLSLLKAYRMTFESANALPFMGLIPVKMITAHVKLILPEELFDS